MRKSSRLITPVKAGKRARLLQYRHAVAVGRRLAIGAGIAIVAGGLATAALRLSPVTSRLAFVPFSGPRELSLPLDSTTRLLVIAPHPDDESIGAAGLIRRVVVAGGAVRIVVLTSGDAFPEGVALATRKQLPGSGDFRAYARSREAETTNAMQQLGVDRSQVQFLGFPDGGLCLLASSYLSAKTGAFASPYTGRREPPASEQVIRDVEYRGADVRRELEAVVAAFQPTLVVLPSVDDDHPDHCAAAIFTHEALNIIDAHRPAPRAELQYLAHTDNWPNQDEPASAPLLPPRGFATGGQLWRRFRLTDAEAELKQRLLTSAYPSQLLVISGFLKAFARHNELFLEGRPRVAPECWCDESHVATELPPERYRRHRKSRR
jgi:LmbE family N-acetylglucosaminyl deacetylase